MRWPTAVGPEPGRPRPQAEVRLLVDQEELVVDQPDPVADGGEPVVEADVEQLMCIDFLPDGRLLLVSPADGGVLLR